MNKKDAKWKSLEDFKALVVSSENPLAIAVEKQVSNAEKVTVYWTEESTSSLFDEEETYKVSISIKLAELLVQSGMCVKQGKDTSAEQDFIALLQKKIEEKNKQVEKQD